MSGLRYRAPSVKNSRVVFYSAAALVVVATLVFTLRNLSQVTAQLNELGRGQLLLLTPALLIMATSVVGLGSVWGLLVVQLSPIGPKFSSLLRLFLYTWPGRYVPGTLPYHVARVLFAERIGTPRQAVGASIAYEAILQVGTAAMVGAVGILMSVTLAESSAGAYAQYVLLVLPLAALPLAFQRGILLPVSSYLLKAAGKEPLPADALLTNRQTATAFAWYCLIHLLNGVAFYLVVAGLGDSSVNPTLAVGAYSLAGVAGVAVPFVPGGIGVREAVLIALMSGAMPAEEAAIAAAAARALSVLADLSPLAVLSSVDFLGGALRLSRRWV